MLMEIPYLGFLFRCYSGSLSPKYVTGISNQAALSPNRIGSRLKARCFLQAAHGS